MDRIARIVVPGYPHHITQRGNRRQQTFFNDSDYHSYIELMSRWCREHAVDIVRDDWKSFLMKAIEAETIEAIKKHERTGRPIGDHSFIEKVEQITGRQLKLRKPGPKPKGKN